jgi:hypothetical protein
VTKLSEGVAQSLAGHTGDLNLSGLTSLSEGVAESLAKHVEDLNLSGLTKLSNKAAQALAKHLGDLDVPTEIRLLLPVVKNRKLIQARMAGFTFLRSVWEGYNDNGGFIHHFIKNHSEIKFDKNVDEDVESILSTNDCNFHVYGDGSVGVLEIDLTTGKGCWWEAFGATKRARLAEFLLRCEWTQTSTIEAELKIKIDEDGYPEVDIFKVKTVPSKSNESLKQNFGWLIRNFDHIEDDEEGIAAIADKLGELVSLVVDVATRSFTFRGQGKKASCTVPSDVLEIKHFNVDLGITPSGTLSAAKRPRK